MLDGDGIYGVDTSSIGVSLPMNVGANAGIIVANSDVWSTAGFSICAGGSIAAYTGEVCGGLKFDDEASRWVVNDVRTVFVGAAIQALKGMLYMAIPP